MKSEVTDSKNIVFKRIAFVLLLLLALELPILVLTRVHIYDVYTQRIASGDTTYSLSEAIEESMMGLYKYNCTLCIVSLLVQICYWGGKAKKGFSKCIIYVTIMKQNGNNCPCMGNVRRETTGFQKEFGL